MSKNLPTFPKEIKKAILESYQSGMSCAEIKEKYDIPRSKRTIERFVSENGITRSPKESFNLAIKNGRVSWDHLKKDKKSRAYRKSISDKKRYSILKRDNFRCVYCGQSPKEGISLQIDHVVRPEDGGTNDAKNLKTVCLSCNVGRYWEDQS